MHRRHADIDGDFLVDDVSQRGGRVEARMQDNFGAQAQAEHQEHGKRVDMEQGQDTKRALLAFEQRVWSDVRRLQILRASRAQVRMRQHRALRLAGRAAGVLDHRQCVRQVAERMGLESAVVVNEFPEGEQAFAVLRLAQHAASPHVRVDRVRRECPFGEFADHQCLEASGSQEFLRLWIERSEVESYQKVGLAVLDLELQPAQQLER